MSACLKTRPPQTSSSIRDLLYKEEDMSYKAFKRKLTAESSLPADVGENRKKLQGKFHVIIDSVFPVKRLRWSAVIIIIVVVAAAVIAFPFALSLSGGENANNHTACPSDWIGNGSKCFYFSEDLRNWPSSQKFCMEQNAHLARFDSMEELDFLKRHKNDSAHWIGLHRKSSKHSWRWTDNTKYNNLVHIRGEGEYAYLIDEKISSGRDQTTRKWICSMPKNYIL